MNDSKTHKKIWIDLDNSPHVPFFVPIIQELESKGYTVLLTARDTFQVVGLTQNFQLKCQIIGKHYGANKFLKVIGTVWRSLQLASVVVKEKPDVSISHGSRPLILLSAILGTPTIQLFDYEHTTSLPFIKPALGMAPEMINTAGLEHRFKRGIRKYHGIKEDVYVESFKPNHSILSQLGIKEDEIVSTIRPPATEAHYHNPESEKLFSEVIDFLGKTPGVRMVILPRNEKLQGEFVRKTWPSWCRDGRIIIPNFVVNGLDLIWCSDFVISGGGTMNREAAALGVPVYSIFRGPLGAVDRYLSEQGRLTLIHSPEEVKLKVRPVRRVKGLELKAGERTALGEIVAGIEEFLSSQGYS